MPGRNRGAHEGSLNILSTEQVSFAFRMMLWNLCKTYRFKNLDETQGDAANGQIQAFLQHEAQVDSFG